MARCDASSRLGQLSGKPVERNRLLSAVDTMHQGDVAAGEVLGTDDDAQGHAAQFPVRVLLPGAHPVATVDTQANPCGALAFETRRRLLHHRGARLVVAARDRDDDDLDRRDFRRKDQAHVVAVRHDHGADGARRQPPRRLKRMLPLVVAGRCTRCRTRA